jgi:excisionase family DNA binding protein
MARPPKRTAAELLSKPTITVPETSEVLGLSRNATYEAVRRGDIQSVKIGTKVIRIPTAPLRRLLGMG